MTLQQIASMGKELAKFLVLLSQSPRLRFAGSLRPGIALQLATQERRSDRPGVRHRASHVTTLRRINQVG